MIGDIEAPIERFFAFARERHEIYLRRQAGLPKPWTQDAILQQYRFCNVYRELDAVTQWIRINWRDPHAEDPDLWFAMVVARLLNLPESMTELGYPVPWDRVNWMRVLRDRKGQRAKNFNGAYIVSTNGRKLFKEVYLADEVLDPLWHAHERARPRLGDSLNSYHMMIGIFNGLGSFMSAQVVADLKYVAPLKQAADWHSFAASGPGSRRGLNRMLGREVNGPWPEDDWRQKLGHLQEELKGHWPRAAMEEPHAQDLQNCLCEWDKYERVRLGQGKPKQKFEGT